MKSSLCGLGHKNQFWANWGKKTYKAISPETCIQFLQTRPQLMQDFKLNKMLYLNIRTYNQFGAWGLKTSFGPIRPKRFTKPYVQNPIPILTNKYSFYPESRGKSDVKINFYSKLWGLKTRFEPTGPKRLTKPYIQNPSSNFHKQDLILSKIKK